MFDIDKNYTRTEIQNLVGGELQTYLPQRNKRILAGCFNYELNPNCPKEVQAGKKPQVRKKAELLMSQTDNVFPVFTKQTKKCSHYKYVGMYRCVGGTNSPNIVQEAEARSGRIGQLSYVLSLESAT